jgi:hypothetical protein
MIKIINKTSKLKKRIKVSKKKNPTYEDFSPLNFKGLEEIGNDIESYLKKNSENFSKIFLNKITMGIILKNDAHYLTF